MSLFGSIGGMINTILGGQKAPYVDAESFESRLKNLQTSGALGSDSKNIQTKNLANINEGYTIAAQQAKDILAGNNSAVNLFDQSIKDQTQANIANAQMSPVNYAQALRTAQEIYDQQVAQAINDATIVKASELQGNASTLGNIGAQLSGQYSNAFNENVSNAAGLQTGLARTDLQRNLNESEMIQRQNAARLAAASSLGTTAMGAFGGTGTQQTQTPTGEQKASMIDSGLYKNTMNIA